MLRGLNVGDTHRDDAALRGGDLLLLLLLLLLVVRVLRLLRGLVADDPADNVSLVLLLNYYKNKNITCEVWSFVLKKELPNDF